MMNTFVSSDTFIHSHGESSQCLVRGVGETIPRHKKTYFPIAFTKYGSTNTTISVCIPCFNEEGEALRRTLGSLRAQILPEQHVMEVLVVMDGIDKMSESMRVYIQSIFGLSICMSDEDDSGKTQDPFKRLPSAETVIVESLNDMVEDINRFGFGRVSLVLKKHNQRKVNSHMWWLGGHAKDLGCEFALATDCGIIFEPTAVGRLLARLEQDQGVVAVTGFQRVMTATMQGDGSIELLTDPLGYALRQIQRFDFELDQSITKSAFDTVGFMPVLPGPCGLYRYKEFGTLEEGVMHQYFTLVNKQVDSIIFGNVQLAEDRIPSCLLVFRDESGSKTVDKSHKPRTGFVHDAIFYFEAEKPLGQLVRQRRRWINGTFAAYLWVVREGWIWKGHHSWSVKLFATLLVFINLIQGVLIRMCGPSLFAVGLYSACLVLPLLLTNTPEQTLDMLYEFEPSKDVSQGIRSMAGLATVAYLLLFAFFMIGHTPRAVPIKEGALKGRWRSDKRSAYRPWLFALGFLANALSLTLLVLMGAIIFVQVGWAATPLAFRLVVLFSVVPYGIALMDGLTNSQIPNATSLVTLLWATPCYLLASITFSIWLPAYTSARISDLSWGTRDNGEDDHQSKDVAKHRTKVGRRMTMTIVLSNVLATGTFIAFQSSVTGSLQVILLSCIGVLSIHFGVAGVDMLIRLFRKLRFVMILCPHDKIEKKKTKRVRSGSSNSSTSIESEDISTDSSSSDDENEDLENARTIITTGHGSSRLNLAEVDIGVECVNIY